MRDEFEDLVESVLANDEPSSDGNEVLPEIPLELPQPHEVSTEMQCKLCGRATRTVCPTCKTPHCDEHGSNIDPSYCVICLNEPAAEVKIAPLKDIDGVTHEGRLITPVGPVYKTLARCISEMSIPELEAYIEQYKELVRQAERSIDFRRTVLFSSQTELEQKRDIERRKRRSGQRTYGFKSPATQATKSTSKTSAKIAGSGLSDAQLVLLLASLKSMSDKNKEGKK